ncbi:leucine-rich repeat domain-containing protein [Adhaeretor mobilis]|uniref:Leucine Rich repeats (2 copies) n=1 Tax=Adhaeretor mobilis TaxID=1930276 RepID=A0A517N264_9BACT|nr:hypothetical protein [Adhaeretor mobilis]QDT01250.1 Leucine Rich repeats (2 copies) [Adhaeretor mobilis]
MRRRTIRYSLKSLLIVFTVVAVYFGIEANRVAKQQAALAILEKAGVSPIYDYEFFRKVKKGRIVDVGPWGPVWLHSLIGADYFRTIVGLNLAGSEISDEEVIQLSSLLHKVRYINLRETNISNKGIGQLWKLTNLEELRLSSTEIGDDGMASIGRCSSLNTLGLADTPVTDSGLLHLKKLSKLQTIHLSYTSVTAEGVIQVLKSSRDTLKWLNVKHTLVDDSIAQHLQGMDTLELINIEETKVTAEGYRIIQESLPDCSIGR